MKMLNIDIKLSLHDSQSKYVDKSTHRMKKLGLLCNFIMHIDFVMIYSSLARINLQLFCS